MKHSNKACACSATIQVFCPRSERYLDALKQAKLMTTKAYQMRLNLQIELCGILPAKTQQMMSLGTILLLIQRLPIQVDGRAN
jgi:hypothetical protein